MSKFNEKMVKMFVESSNDKSRPDFRIVFDAVNLRLRGQSESVDWHEVLPILDKFYNTAELQDQVNYEKKVATWLNSGKATKKSCEKCEFYSDYFEEVYLILKNDLNDPARANMAKGISVAWHEDVENFQEADRKFVSKFD